VLDGLLYHESDLRIEEHYTDTAGFTDHVFALCHLLGFHFAPRIRDLADKRLYVPGKAAQWPTLIGDTTPNVKNRTLGPLSAAHPVPNCEVADMRLCRRLIAVDMPRFARMGTGL
jgi:Tn3 transposase DDE domain